MYHTIKLHMLIFSLENMIEIFITMCEHAYQKEKFVFIAFTNFYFLYRIGASFAN